MLIYIKRLIMKRIKNKRIKNNLITTLENQE